MTTDRIIITVNALHHPEPQGGHTAIEITNSSDRPARAVEVVAEAREKSDPPIMEGHLVGR